MFLKQNSAKLPALLPGFEHVNRDWDPACENTSGENYAGECDISAQGEMIATVQQDVELC